MRKRVILTAVLITALVMTGCASSGGGRASNNDPEWLNETPSLDIFWGVGLVKLSDPGLALETATTRAQRDIARQINALVQGLLIDYANSSGLAGDARTIQSIDNIGRNLINMQLSGSIVDKRWSAPDGTRWVRVSYSKSNAQKQVNQIVNNEMADYAEFKADQALKRLDFELEKAQSKPESRNFD